MIEYAKIVLWGVSFRKQLFHKELRKILDWCNNEEKRALEKYCYEKYYDMHPEIIDDVFMHEKNRIFNVVAVKSNN